MMKKEGMVHIVSLVIRNLGKIVSEDRSNVYYFLYYSMLESVLLMVSPLTSAFIINSVLAHATISITVLSIIVVSVFSIIAGLQVLKEYMIEKFEQKIFVKNSIRISQLALKLARKDEKDIKTIDKYMNYFFEVVSIQKLFPIVLLNGFGLFIKVVVSLILLLIFDISFFVMGVFFIFLFVSLVLVFGRKGAKLAIERSDAKHETIYFLQNIPFSSEPAQKVLQRLDELLVRFIKARDRMFRVIVKQLSLTFVMEGVVLSTFFIVGGYLVFEGIVPIGEFVATEIIIISVISALRDFMKQIDYFYDMVEGFYKIDKLSNILKEAR